jgi:hypothetical protein
LAAANLAVWIAKEVSDFFREKRLATAAAGKFPFNSRELWWNIFTALFFIGIVVASVSLFDPLSALKTSIVVLPFVLGIGVWRLRRKITFQQAGLPYLYRLANFPPNLTDAEARKIEALLNPRAVPDCRHLVLAGPIGAGKTSLIAGIGTEFAFRMGIGRYTTLVKLLQSNLKDPRGGVQEFQDGRTLWPWQNSDLLVIDDVDNAGDMAASLTHPSLLTEPPIAQVKIALSQLLDETVKAGLAARKTVWVIGDTDPTPWMATLQDVFGITGRAIGNVVLTETIQQRMTRKQTIPMRP